MNAEEFYDKISENYNVLLEKAVPRYREMLFTLLHYIPGELNPATILELGCGTGNLTELVVAKYPLSKITAVDYSEKAIGECRSRLNPVDTIVYDKKDFRELNYKPASFDLVISSISIHHLTDGEKQILFDQVYHFLKKGGYFLYADQCKGRTSEIYQKHMDTWKDEAIKLGSTGQDWKTWMEHQDQHDFHAAATDQLKWLEQSGFSETDIVWRNLLWTVFHAVKK